MAVSNYATQGKDIGVADTTLPVNAQAVQGFADVLGTAKEYVNTKTVQGFEQQERAQYENYIDFSKEAGTIEEGLRLQGEAQNRTLTAEEQARVTEFENMAKMDEEAYKQGVTNRNRYQLNAQRRLRAAITSRPDLAEEFRRTSVKEIGTDVSTYALQYYWENLDAAGKALEKKPLSPTDLDKRMETGKDFIKGRSAEEQADFSNRVERQYTAAMMSGDYARADATLRSYETQYAGDPAMDEVAQVNVLLSDVDSLVETLGREAIKMSDANYASVLAADPAAANDARIKIMGMRSKLESTVSSLSSYKNSSIWSGKSGIAIDKSNRALERLDAAFGKDYSTKGVQENSALAYSAILSNTSPAVTGQARVAGLYGNKATKEMIEQGLATLSLGETLTSKKGSFITKAQAVQIPLQNHNALVTGLATNVADNASDVKINYAMYAKSYVNATMPFVAEIKPSLAGGMTEVRATSDYTDSLDGVFSVTNRNEAFVEDLWNNAAESRDSGVHQGLAKVRLLALNSYSQSVYMEVLGNYPELSQYVRPRDFVKSASGGRMDVTAPLVLVGNYSKEDEQKLGTILKLYDRADSEYNRYFAKTGSYVSSIGMRIGNKDGE